MSYEFDFTDVFAAWPELLQALVDTLILSASAMVLGLVVSILGALGRETVSKRVMKTI